MLICFYIYRCFIIFLIYDCKQLFMGLNMLYQSLSINTFGHLVICKAWLLFWYTHVFLNFLFLLIDYLIETFVERGDERMALSTLCLFVNMTNHMTLNVIITQCQAFVGFSFFINLHKIFWNAAIDFKFDKAFCYIICLLDLQDSMAQ